MQRQPGNSRILALALLGSVCCAGFLAGQEPGEPAFIAALDPRPPANSPCDPWECCPDDLFSVPGDLAPKRFRLRGRIDTDFISSLQSQANQATYGELGDAVGLRRARIGAEGELSDASRYIVEIDLASGDVVPRDIYFGRPGPRGWEHRLGHFREPFSLEGGTSANTLAFLERSPINTLDPARNWGLGLFRTNADAGTSLALGLFHAGTDTSDFQGGDGSTVGLTARWTAAPIHDPDGGRLLHFGVALSERIPEQGVIVINQRPRSPLLQFGDSSLSPFVPTIAIPADFQQLVNLQWAAGQGPVWIEAEWYGTLIDQSAGPPVCYHGCHVDCGCFVTGEHREYLASGVWGPVRVERPLLAPCATGDRPSGWGAWELVARFAYLDFFDRDAPTGPAGQLVGIRQSQGTWGVNWYWTDHLRLMFNYTYAVPEEPNVGTSAASVFASRLACFW